MDTKKLTFEFTAHTYDRFPVEIVGGSGCHLTDETGKTYIDLGSGIAVNSLGMAFKEWQDAVIGQILRFQHCSNLYYSAPCAKLAEMLCARTGYKKVFFANSGAEANECAIKAARRFSFLKHNDENHGTVITLKNGFHGRTITTLSATGQDSLKTGFGPLTPGFVHADPEDASSVRRFAEKGDCAAVMIELIQGEGGVNVLTPGFVAEIVSIAKEFDLLVIADEIQTGNGRTGKLFSYMHYGFVPDIVTTAKGLAGGLPLGAVLLGEKVKDVFSPGTHGSTFGGNPIACAGAISVLSALTDELLAGVTKRQKLIVDALSDAPGVSEISGMGLMLGISCARPAKEIIAQCIENGVLVLSAKEKVRLLPPLNIPIDDLMKAVNVLKEALAG
ncbi:MAG: acetylornithine transaminase [Oscillospiraceae bacterium]|nr:acetylornithine transaminase [Oscillospiraceae bacterium]